MGFLLPLPALTCRSSSPAAPACATTPGTGSLTEVAAGTARLTPAMSCAQASARAAEQCRGRAGTAPDNRYHLLPARPGGNERRR